MSNIVNFNDYAPVEVAQKVNTVARVTCYDDDHCLFPGVRRAWWIAQDLWMENEWWVKEGLCLCVDMGIDGYYDATTKILIGYDHLKTVLCRDIIPACAKTAHKAFCESASVAAPAMKKAGKTIKTQVGKMWDRCGAAVGHIWESLKRSWEWRKDLMNEM